MKTRQRQPPALPTPRRVRPPNPALLSIEEAAERLGVGIRTARAWVADGMLYSVPVGLTGRVRRIPAGEVERMRVHHGISTVARDTE